MGSPCYRYHRDHLNGMIFDSDELPSEEDGWFDSPKKCVKFEAPLPTVSDAPMSSEFPDPKPFAHIRAYVAAVDPMIPKILTAEEAAASGKPEEELEEMRKAAVSMQRRALLYYASRKYNKELAKNGAPDKLFEKCMVLDAGGDPA